MQRFILQYCLTTRFHLTELKLYSGCASKQGGLCLTSASSHGIVNLHDPEQCAPLDKHVLILLNQSSQHLQGGTP